MDHHLGKPNKSSASQRINHHQHRRPTDYTERAHLHRHTVTSSSRQRPRHDLDRQGRTVGFSSWCPSRRPTSTHRLTSRLRHLGWTRGFAISSSTYTPETSASLADQLRHVSWTEGFASVSQPLPALPCRRFIAHQAMGCHSPSSGLACLCIRLHASCLNSINFEMGMTSPSTK